MKKILITGGNGTIGGFTIPFLKDEGYEVDNYDLASDTEDDIWNKERLKERMKGKDVVYHLVAIPHPFLTHENDYWHINHEGTIAVFQCAKECGVKKFIFASSLGVYACSDNHAKPDKFPISEDNYKPSLGEGQSIYGLVKLATEKYLKEESQKAGIRTVALRISGIGHDIRIDNVSSRRHAFFSASSPENYHQLLKLVIEKDLDSFFEVFNTGDEYLHPSIDVQQRIKRYWPGVPNYTKDNEALYSIEKAKKLLGYKPSIPKTFSEPGWRTTSMGIRRRIFTYAIQRLYNSRLKRIVLGE